jgi:hypothetical protein
MVKAGVGTVLIALFAGAIGGLAASQLSRPETTGAAEPDRAASVSPDEVAALRGEITRLTARIDELSMELAAERAKAEEVARKLDEKPEADLAQSLMELATKELSGQAGAGGAPGGIQITGGGTHRIRLSGLPGTGTVIGPGGQPAGASQEERWENMRRDLSLDSYQLDELKRIRDDYHAGMKEALTGARDGRFDISKLNKVREDANARVKNLLSEEQYEKYRKGGWSRNLGLGGAGTSVITVTTGEIIEDEGK